MSESESELDAVTEPVDAGATEPVDAGATEPVDAGATEPADAGVTEPADAGGESAADANAEAPLAPYQDLSESEESGSEDLNLDMVLDIPVSISMEIGKAEIPIRNLLQLNPGSIIELDRLAGEALDVQVNETLIAHGEVVVVNDKFGIRLTDIISSVERINKIK